MSIVGAFILPHPPIIIPEVGNGQEKKIQKTIGACKECGKRIEDLKPDIIVLASPHSILYEDYFHISPGKAAKGNLRKFGTNMVELAVDYDVEFVTALEELAAIRGISAGTMGERDATLDHGTLIPLVFVNRYYTEYKLVRVGLSGLPLKEHYKLGMAIADCARKLNRKTVFLASGDLSHKVSYDGPYGFAVEGVKFDKEVTSVMADGDFLRILTLEPEFTEKAAECGLRSFVIMAGSLDKMNVSAQLLSYEGTFGVGYGVASFIPETENKEKNLLDIYEKMERERMKELKDKESEYVRLARYSLENYIKTGMRGTLPKGISSDLITNKAGVFVSLKKNGILRGCIGTILPVTSCIAEEILRNAVSAATEDPRFNPIEECELNELVYSVDVLSPPEPISGKDMLDVKRYGVIITCGYKRGLLLPNLEGIDTVEEQIQIAMQKAGISPGEPITLERFEVVRYK